MKTLKPIFLLLASCLLLLASCFCGAGQVRGIWVECEGTNETLSSPQKLDEMIQAAEGAGIDNIFLQVYRHNRSWYNSTVADTTPFSIIWKKHGIDPLGYTITKAHKKGIKVHAWINIYRVGKDINAPIVKKLGRDIITRDGIGKSLLDYPVDKLPDGGYWLDPGDPEVHIYLLKVAEELLQNYPQADGIHLDFIRYPYKDINPGSRWAQRKDFGYGRRSVERFGAQYGFSPLKMDLTDILRTQQWDQWRRDQVSGFVRDAYKLCKKINPKVCVSCAVQSWPDRAYMVSYQDWRAWLEEKTLDFVILMNYSTDRKLAKYLSQAAVNLPYNSGVYIGLGAYLMLNTPQILYLQIKDCQELNAKGIVLFSYDALLKNKKIFKALIQEKWWKK